MRVNKHGLPVLKEKGARVHDSFDFSLNRLQAVGASRAFHRELKQKAMEQQHGQQQQPDRENRVL